MQQKILRFAFRAVREIGLALEIVIVAGLASLLTFQVVQLVERLAR